MSQSPFLWSFFWTLHVLIQVALIVRVLLRPHREPASRIAWIVVIIAVPVLGILSYILLGETNIGRRRVERMRAVLSRLPDMAAAKEADAANLQADVPQRYVHLFQAGKTVNGFDPVGGNRARLLEDSNATIAAMVADIDAAQDHVHLLFYIWLPDNNGCKVVRGAEAGCGARRHLPGHGGRPGLAHHDPLRTLARPCGKRASVWPVALPIGNPLLRPLKGRIDLRNHRKIVVIDDVITYCGSQNCADPEFLVKAKYAPWVDAMMRFEGPIARQNQHLFVGDWMASVDEDISHLLRQPIRPAPPGLPAQVVGTGPTLRYSAMPEMFESLMYTARRELVISTPYYVPDEAMQAGLCASAHRGVDTTVIFPAKQRLLDRGRGQSKLLRRFARCRGPNLRVRGRAVAYQIPDS